MLQLPIECEFFIFVAYLFLRDIAMFFKDIGDQNWGM